MIPKKIHFCWFGGKPFTDLTNKCIESWKKNCPDYEIVLWNEENFDVNSCDYVKEAYERKKWAFVSDYVRFKVLFEYGGVYLDTDVELLKPIDEILEKGAFMACEEDAKNTSKNASNRGIQVAPGLAIAAPSGMEIYGDIIRYYEERHFVDINGNNDLTTVVEIVTSILKKNGLEEKEGIQEVKGIWIYPKEYFNPYDFETGEIILNQNTYSIHHYAASWTSKRNKINTFVYHTITRLKRWGKKQK